MTYLRMTLLVAAMAFLFTACSGHGEMDQMGALSSQMRTLNDDHHENVAKATDANAILEETNRYTAEMEQMMSDMEATCSEMMGGHQGMMGAADVTELCGMQDSMMESMSEHKENTTAMEDVSVMQAECDEHFANMDDMLDQMQAMMGGGMM